MQFPQEAAMRTVVAVDRSDQPFRAVQVVCRPFTHEELTFIHAVDLRPFENPLFAQPLRPRSAEELRQMMVDAGERLLEQTGLLVTPTIPSIQPIHKIGNPAPVVRETIRSARVDLVAVGSQGTFRSIFDGGIEQWSAVPAITSWSWSKRKCFL